MFWTDVFNYHSAKQLRLFQPKSDLILNFSASLWFCQFFWQLFSIFQSSRGFNSLIDWLIGIFFLLMKNNENLFKKRKKTNKLQITNKTKNTHSFTLKNTRRISARNESFTTKNCWPPWEKTFSPDKWTFLLLGLLMLLV